MNFLSNLHHHKLTKKFITWPIHSPSLYFLQKCYTSIILCCLPGLKYHISKMKYSGNSAEKFRKVVKRFLVCKYYFQDVWPILCWMQWLYPNAYWTLLLTLTLFHTGYLRGPISHEGGQNCPPTLKSAMFNWAENHTICRTTLTFFYFCKKLSLTS